MINVSSAFKQALENGNRTYLEYVEITLRDGNVLNLTNAHIWQSGFSIEDAVSSDSDFQIGSAIINKATLTLKSSFSGVYAPIEDTTRDNLLDTIPEIIYGNTSDDLHNYDFSGARVVCSVGLQLERGIEIIKKGTYVVADNPEYDDAQVQLECYDYMSKFDWPYSNSNTVYPATLSRIIRDACSDCDVILGTVTFPHSDFIIQNKPDVESMTYREMISYVATIAGCYARCNAEGYLELKWYDQNALHNAYENPDFGISNVHYINTSFSHTRAADLVVITGLRILVKTETNNSANDSIKTYFAGSEGYIVEISNNPLITEDNVEEIKEWLATQIIGFTFAKAQISHLSDPTIEAGDVAIYTDKDWNHFPIIVSKTTFTVGEQQTTTSSAQTPARNSAERISEITKNYIEMRKRIFNEKTDSQQAYEDLENRLNSKEGLFSTIEVDSATGSNIYYLHDKPLLSESGVIWKMTAEAWGVSTDGGRTWNGGMTVDGDVIARILTATGVNADWINAGEFVVRDENNNVIFSANKDTKQVYISGRLTAISDNQSINDAIDSAKTEAEQEADARLAEYALSTNAEIAQIKNRLDGTVSSYFEDYAPTLENYPASEWDTDEKKDQHIGTYFYDKTTEISYRFFKNDDGTYEWTIITDTVATEAFSVANRALSLANYKCHVFMEQPVAPYDVGDIWFTGTEILVCNTARETAGAYYRNDWGKLDNYAETSDIEILQQQVDNKIETWYQDTDPEQGWTEKTLTSLLDLESNPVLDTSSNEVTGYWDSEKYKHLGDIWYRTTDNEQFRYSNGIWEKVKASDELIDTIDGKKTVYYGDSPAPPYAVRDLWVQGEAGDILVCTTGREEGESFSASDWVLASKYTDDSALTTWIAGDYSDTIAELQEQTDQKAETWYQVGDPSLAWNTEELKDLHIGDLWYKSDDNTTWYWNGIEWKSQTIPTEIFNTINGKAQIFAVQPTTPYYKDDIWFTGTEIMVCKKTRTTGVFDATEWGREEGYTDDSSLNTFVSDTYEPEIDNLQGQIDGKIELYYYDYVPTATNLPAVDWTTDDEREKHVGDLFYNTTSGAEGSYRYEYDSGKLTYGWKKIVDADITQALADAATAQAVADSKRTIFVEEPVTPYYVGDMWITGNTSDGEILYCITEKTTGDFDEDDWAETPTQLKANATFEMLNGEIIAQVVQGNIVNAINISGEGIAINASKLNINGAVSANNYFKIKTDGTFETIKGTIGAITIESDKLYSNNHKTLNSSTPGFLFASDGSFSVGDNQRFFRYYKQNDAWKTDMQVDNLTLTVANGLTIAGVQAATIEDIENTNVGGRNLFINTEHPSTVASERPKLINQANDTIVGANCLVAQHGIRSEKGTSSYPRIVFGATNVDNATLNGLSPGDYTLSFDTSYKLYTNGDSATTYTYYVRVYGWGVNNDYTYKVGKTIHAFSKDDLTDRGVEFSEKVKFTFTIPDDATKFYITVRPSSTATGVFDTGDFIELRDLKIETGVVATDWTPALEDTSGDIASAISTATSVASADATAKADEAAKTATNYLYYSSEDGLIVTEAVDQYNTVGSQAYNTQIKGDGIYFRKGRNKLSYISGSAFTLYRPGNNDIKAMELLSNGLFFYKYDGETVASKFTDVGLEIITGKIGGFTIDQRSIYLGELGTANSAYFSIGTNGQASIGGSANIGGWALAIGTTFGVTIGGKLYCTSMQIGGINVSATSIYSGSHTNPNVTNDSGFCLTSDGQFGVGNGTDYIRFTKNGNNVYSLIINASSMTIGQTSVATATTVSDAVAGAVSTAADDATGKANEAAKTATNYLYYSADDGLVVSVTGGSAGSQTSPYNTQIKGDGIYFRNSRTILGKISGTSFTLYRPGSSQLKSMELTSGGLTFYKFDGSTVSSQFTNNGLEIATGTIGGFIIDSTSIHKGTLGNTGSAYFSTGTSGRASIGGSTEISGWALTIGNTFGVTTAGKLFCNNLQLTGALTLSAGSSVGGINVSATSIYSGSHTTPASTYTGFCLTSDGQFGVGNSNEYIRFTKNNDNVYSLAIKASSITLGASTVATTTAVTSAINTAKNDAISTAASDATTKANTAKNDAISAAASDATTKANTAKNDAISTASSDATTKANNAKTAAIDAAASDATTKANAAKNDAISAAATDATTKANAAAKTATNYLHVTSSGLVVNNNESSVGNGYNVYIKSDSISFRNGTNTLSSLSGSALNFYKPGTSTLAAYIDATNGLYVSSGKIGSGITLDGANSKITLTKYQYATSSRAAYISATGGVYAGEMKCDTLQIGESLTTPYTTFKLTSYGIIYANGGISTNNNGALVLSAQSGGVSITSATTISSTLTVANKLTANSSLSVGTSLTAASASISGTLKATGALTASSTLTVGGATTINASSSFKGSTVFYNHNDSKSWTHAFHGPMQLYNLQNSSTDTPLYIRYGSDHWVVKAASSSLRYKTIEYELPVDEKWYDINVYWAKYKEGYLADDDCMNGRCMPMFIAEEVEKAIPEAVRYNENGQVEDWNSRVLIPVMFQMIKSQKREIDSLRKELSEIGTV